jgi:hypothetical protein
VEVTDVDGKIDIPSIRHLHTHRDQFVSRSPGNTWEGTTSANVETRIWPPGNRAGEHWPCLDPCYAARGDVARRRRTGGPNVLPGADDSEHMA